MSPWIGGRRGATDSFWGRMMQRSWVALLAVLAFVVGLWCAPWIYRATWPAPETPDTDSGEPPPLLLATPTPGDRDLPRLSLLYEQLSPSVVNISVLTADTSTGRGRGYGLDAYVPLRESRGSGLVLTRDGSVLTNHHVIAGARQVQVQLADGRVLPASVVGSHEATDLALLQLESDSSLQLQPVILGNSSSLRVGEWVFAIGNPFGLNHSLTTGVVSYIGRPPGDETLLFDFIQTDTAINPGNSGGPLFNLAGEVVGINTAILGDAEGIGFSIPIDTVRAVVPVLRETGEFHRGYLGVTLAPADDPTGGGAAIARVFEGTPADSAGIQPGDVLRRIGERDIESPHTVPQVIGLSPPGTELLVELQRGDTVVEVPVVIGDFEALSEAAEIEVPSLGITVSPAGEEDRRRARLAGSGLVVGSVDPAGPAGRSLTPGDVVFELDYEPVDDPVRFAAQLQQSGRHLLLVSRRGRVFPLWVQ